MTSEFAIRVKDVYKDFNYSGEHLVSVTTPAGTTRYSYVTGQGAAAGPRAFSRSTASRSAGAIRTMVPSTR